MSKLRITDGHGIHLTFDNGFTVSIQIGGGNYGDNYDFEIGPITRANPLPFSRRAEVAILTPGGDLMSIGDPDDKYRNSVLAYVPIDQVLDLVNIVRATKGKPSVEEVNTAISDFWTKGE